MSLPIPNIRKMLRQHFGTGCYKINYLGEVFIYNPECYNATSDCYELYGYVDDNADCFCVYSATDGSVLFHEPIKQTESYLQQIKRELTPKPMFEII